MTDTFDFIVVGGGSAGAVVAARLSEDPACRVAVIEAGERPPEERMPVACGSMQLDPATDWMYTADPGRAGLGLRGRRMPVPRGRMLGGSSGINYMAYVRGHSGDPRLRVTGVDKLRVADASVMPNIVSGNTNATAIMIGEKAAEMVAADRGVALAAFVGERAARTPPTPRIP